MWSDSDDYNRGSCINHCDSMAAEEIGGQADAGNNAGGSPGAVQTAGNNLADQ